MKNISLSLINIYQRSISPYLPVSCRYEPTCSAYSHLAIETHGVFWGIWLTIKRLSRCRPMGGHGYDPVP
ncbi:MAG: membrane protein insertion efficiency factor YidD [Dehalococcoidia bacterium]|nr:membrane protein insertion efficiency factor YidD [Dehalococcoidia bacterium]MQF99285.1 membrane protein insertion efficiency factor YidD [SAR202 cluster bacterium]